MGKKVFITITGMNHRFGQAFLEPRMKVLLVKEPDNEYDREAIKVMLDGLGHIGYVANSTYTVLGDSISAGRLYDKIGQTAVAKVKYILPKGAICTVSKKSLRGTSHAASMPRDRAGESAALLNEDIDF